MDAFEEIVAGLLWEEGYWTTIGYKVNLPKEKKALLGKPSLPRPELDVLAYQASENRIIWVECKSYLDSQGIKINALIGEDKINSQRYKVFTWPLYRETVTKSLIKQVVKMGLTKPAPTIEYCLASGKIATDDDREKLHLLFKKNGWLLLDEYWVKRGLEKLANKGYQNDVAIIVAKLFSRIK